MSLKIPVAHDFICPWCWVGLLQAKKLIAEEGVEIEWKGYELIPEELPWPDHAPTPPIPNKPLLLSRFEFLLVADGVELPKVDKPSKMRSHNAHEAAEYAKARGKGFEFVEAAYRAYWERGVNINDPAQLICIAESLELDPVGLLKAIQEKTYKAEIVGFDDPAYASGVFNVPTFYIGEERYAEQPYTVLKKAVRATTQP
jgi:predicted DsbA family dithiol-disulfide isomerase